MMKAAAPCRRRRAVDLLLGGRLLRHRQPKALLQLDYQAPTLVVSESPSSQTRLGVGPIHEVFFGRFDERLRGALDRLGRLSLASASAQLAAFRLSLCARNSSNSAAGSP